MSRILYVIDGLPSGGAERQLSLLLKYLPRAWDRRVVSLAGGPYHQVLLDQHTDVAVYPRRSRFDPLPAFRLCSEILQYRPDIIHSWGGLSSALVAPISKLLHISLVDGSIRIANPASRHGWRRRLAFSLSDHIVPNSYAAISAYRIPASKSSVIYNALDPDRLKSIKPGTGKQEGLTTVVMTGRISPFKDFSSFFEAARRLSAREPHEWKFVAVGAGSPDDRSRFRALAGNLVAAGVVDLPDAGLEVFPYLQAADIGVLLSAANFKEGISNSIMEYMACGLPVICSDSGGNRELVVDDETGFVIPSEHVDSFVEKLLFLKSHRDVAQRMGEAGCQRVASLCGLDRMIKDYEALYARMLSKNHKRYPEGGFAENANGRGSS